MNVCFYADASLGKLVKWLRILGFDTRYLKKYQETDTLDDPKAGAIVLTRTRRLLKTNRAGRIVFIASNDPFEQVGEVIRTIGLVENDLVPFSRCLGCNSKIEKIEKTVVKGKIPDYIWETHDSFKICRRCDKIFWPGSHTQRCMKMIRTLFKA